MCNPSTSKASDILSKKEDYSKRSISHNGVLFGSISAFVSILGAAITFPFLQSRRDDLNCDALCYGTMQSTRSGLTLVGAFVVGRLSDKFGRSKILWLGIFSSLLSYILNWRGETITEMWISMIPSSLLNQNFSVLKALFADYNEERGGTESERASSMGRLGMAVGFGFMIGPVLGTTFLKNYSQATAAAFCLTLLSGIFIMWLPTPHVKHADVSSKSKRASSHSILSLLSLPAAKSKGAQLLFVMRCLMALAFNIFMTVWTVSVKQRFEFGPRDHAYFMGWVGLWYALSQGVLARVCIRLSGEDPTNALLCCISWLAIGRVIAMTTPYLWLVYIVMAMVIVSLGIVNTAMSSACSHLASADQVGGLFGILEAIESASGLIGPTLGGLLHKLGSHVVVGTVVFIYALIFLAVLFFYRTTIVLHQPDEPESNNNNNDNNNVSMVALANEIKMNFVTPFFNGIITIVIDIDIVFAATVSLLPASIILDADELMTVFMGWILYVIRNSLKVQHRKFISQVVFDERRHRSISFIRLEWVSPLNKHYSGSFLPLPKFLLRSYS
eukprot:gene7280-14841_t